MIRPLTAAEAVPVSGGGQLINSQKADQLRRIFDQNATPGWRFD
jgi:hypothetical protein